MRDARKGCRSYARESVNRSRTKVRTHIEDRELGEDSTQFFIERVLCEFDLAHVEIAYAADLEVFVDDLEHHQLLDIEMIKRHTVGVFRWVLDRTMSKKSAAVGTGAIAFNPLVDIVMKSYSVVAPGNGEALTWCAKF